MTDRPTCILAGCDRPAKTRGLCQKHYDSHRNAGDLDNVALPCWRPGMPRAKRGTRKPPAQPTYVAVHDPACGTGSIPAEVPEILALRARVAELEAEVCDARPVLEAEEELRTILMRRARVEAGIDIEHKPTTQVLDDIMTWRAREMRREREGLEAEISSLRQQREDHCLADERIRRVLHGPLGLGETELDAAGMAERAAARLADMETMFAAIESAIVPFYPPQEGGPSLDERVGYLAHERSAEHLNLEKRVSNLQDLCNAQRSALRQAENRHLGTYGAWLDMVEAGARKGGVVRLEIRRCEGGTWELCVERVEPCAP